MERRVERGARRELARRKPREDVLERERVVAERVGVLLDVRERRLRRLAVARDRRRLAEAGHAGVPQLDDERLGRVARLARDDERLGELERHDPRRDLHRAARLHWLPRAPVAQGIERAPPEREVGGSIPAGRITTPLGKPTPHASIRATYATRTPCTTYLSGLRNSLRNGSPPRLNDERPDHHDRHVPVRRALAPLTFPAAPGIPVAAPV